MFLFTIISKVNLSPALSIICMVIITKVMKSIVVVSVIGAMGVGRVHFGRA
jgi:hypothetical protein